MKLFITLCVFVIVLLALLFVADRNRGKVEPILAFVNRLSVWQVSLALFVSTLLLDSIHIFYKKIPFVADEVYTLSGGAFFAGYDWSSYMSVHKFYNFGYTMLLSPLFRIINDPVMLYRSLLFVNVVLEGLAIVVAYRVLRVQLGLNNTKSIAIALASACSSLILQFHTYVYNEMPLALLVWLSFAILLRLIDTKGKEKVLLSVLLGLFVGYTYIIHSRCVILFVAVAVLLISYLLVYRKWLCNPVATGVTFGAVIYGSRRLIDYVQVHLYRIGLSENMNNSVEDVVTGGTGSRYENFKSLTGIFKLIKQFLSLAGAMNIALGGLLLILTIVALYAVFRYHKDYQKDKAGKQMFVMGVFSFISFWGIVACIAIIGANNGFARFLAYSRYFTPFIGPFLLFAFVMLLKNRHLSEKALWMWTGIGSVAVALVYVFYSLPVFQGVSMKNNASLYMFMCFSLYEEQVNFSKNVIAVALAIMVAGSVLFLLLYRKRRIIPMCMMVFGFSVILFWNLEQRQNQQASDRRYEMSNGSYAVLQSGIPFNDLDVYYGGSGLYTKATVFTLYNKDVTYLDDVNVLKDLEDAVLLTNQPVKYLENANTDIYQLDDNEYILTENQDMSEALASAGYTRVECSKEDTEAAKKAYEAKQAEKVAP